MDNQRGNPPTTTIATRVGDLPVGLLGRAVIQHLPWGKRVQVEGVCTSWQREALAYGWEDVKHIEGENRNGGVRLQPISWVPLLSRVGPSITTLNLIEGAYGLREDKLLVGLMECPKLKHLRIWWRQLIPQVLDHICRTYASTLKSLRLSANGLRNTEVATKLNKALSRLPTLEYLWVDDWTFEVEPLRLPASSLGNLRHLSLYNCIIGEDNFEELAALPSLRSLSMWDIAGMERGDLSTLQRSQHLEHLCIQISAENMQRFIDALPHLGASLKALGLVDYLSVTELKQLLPPITAHLQQLEHLGLWVGEPNEQEVAVEKEKLLDLLASPQLNSLRSLSFRARKISGWGWLERICQVHQQRLEYLEVYGTPPLATICSIVKECKSLRRLRFSSFPSWSVADLRALTEVAAAVGENSGNEQVALKSHPLPTLFVAFDYAEMIREAKLDDSSRLRFVSWWNKLGSHVLHQYRFGCLSEGRPAFDE